MPYENLHQLACPELLSPESTSPKSRDPEYASALVPKVPVQVCTNASFQRPRCPSLPRHPQSSNVQRTPPYPLHVQFVQPHQTFVQTVRIHSTYLLILTLTPVIQTPVPIFLLNTHPLLLTPLIHLTQNIRSSLRIAVAFRLAFIVEKLHPAR